MIPNSSPHLVFSKDSAKKSELRVGDDVNLSVKLSLQSGFESESFKISYVNYPDPSFKDRADLFEQIPRNSKRLKKERLKEGLDYKIADLIDFPPNKGVKSISLDYTGGNKYGVINDPRLASFQGRIRKDTQPLPSELTSNISIDGKATISVIWKQNLDNLKLEVVILAEKKEYKLVFDPLDYKLTNSARAYVSGNAYSTIDRVEREGKTFIVGFVAAMVTEIVIENKQELKKPAFLGYTIKIDPEGKVVKDGGIELAGKFD